MKFPVHWVKRPSFVLPTGNSLSSRKTGLCHALAGSPRGLGNRSVRCFMCSRALVLILVYQVGLTSHGPGQLQLRLPRAVWCGQHIGWHGFPLLCSQQNRHPSPPVLFLQSPLKTVWNGELFLTFTIFLAYGFLERKISYSPLSSSFSSPF